MTETVTLDSLWVKIQGDPSLLSQEDLATMVSLYRKQRTNAKAGIKAKKDKGPALTLNPASLGIAPSGPRQSFRRLKA